MSTHNYYQIEFIVRPLDEWPRAETEDRERSPFDSGWKKTVDLLAREISNLGGDRAVMQADITEHDRRKDGWIRATAKPGPRVALTFDSDRGPLTFYADKFTNWQDNIRAIAKGLEALRMVDRYGITDSAEQYRGFGALPAGSGPTSKDAARLVIISAAGIEGPGAAELAESATDFGLKSAYKSAVKKTHPDTGGDRDDFEAVQMAAQLLGLA